MTASVIRSDPDIQGGAPVFVGTRVPIGNLFDWLEAGDSIEDFLESFPSVTREQVTETLALARKALVGVSAEPRVRARAARGAGKAGRAALEKARGRKAG